ncbi:helix-turn-helix domain-containing protein [Shewanella dokdonensis]|nr:helix-turn-helix transcriptional regulator [Shewanella dokdonensis]MCL1072950.1 helix-turn-helix domain-containing protein [Shewanella dokdonensis]
MTESSLGDNIHKRMTELNLTQREVADMSGLSQVTIHKLISGKVKGTTKILELSKALQCSPERLLYGIDPIKRDPVQNASYMGMLDAWDDSTTLGEDEVELPFYTEVQLAAGNGIIAVNENRGPKLRFSKSTLRNQKVDPLAAVCVKVAGNSMEPVLPNNTTVGIDTATKNIIDGKMYAINHDGMLRIKLLYKLPGNGIRVRSYNQDEYPDEIYPGDQAKVITVIGKIFWYSVLL